jgi:hypothetical protein
MSLLRSWEINPAFSTKIPLLTELISFASFVSFARQYFLRQLSRPDHESPNVGKSNVDRANGKF